MLYSSNFFFCRVNTSNLTALEKIVHNNYTSTTIAIGNCVLDEGAVAGKKKLNITSFPGYVISVTVSDGKKASQFTQMLSVLEGDPPNMKLE